MHLWISGSEVSSLRHHLAAYLDNERDKGPAGIGSDQMDLLEPLLEACGERELNLSEFGLLQLALVREALTTHGADDLPARAIVQRIDAVCSASMLESCGPANAEEALDLAHCLNVYLDNEADKAPCEGIGTELSGRIEPMFQRWAAGEADNRGLDLVVLAHAMHAADLFAEDDEVDYDRVQKMIEVTRERLGLRPDEHQNLPRP